MTFQSQKISRSKDPFSVQPLPKSFYHPSPTKDVNEREVIRSPQRRNNPSTKCAEVEEFLRRSPTFHASALPNVKTLHDLEKSRSGLLKQGEVIDSSELDETWPDSERPYSVSSTSAPEDTEAGSPDVNVGDAVKGLGELQYRRSTVGVMDSRTSDKRSALNTGESVLQRYVERFRSSSPKSREERMKEKSEKLHFWWLQSSSDRGPNSADADDSKRDNLKLDQSLSEARPQTHKLTKDALLAMDEETFHLQSKADRLLSRSELSLASSSPVVSTEGLGSSNAGSNSSVMDGHRPYQPACIQVQENYNRPAARLFERSEGKSRLFHTASRSPSDDILTRWRLQRKREEASTAVTGSQCGKLSSIKSSRNTELDVRLEEFRRKILSQKALVTQQDILYERQKLSLLMDDARLNEDTLNKDAAQPQSEVVEVEEPTRDIILEKLQRITRCQDYRPAVTEASPRNMNHGKTVSSIAASADDRNFSINNANFAHAEFRTNVDNAFVDPALNKNNTAVLGQQVLQNNNVNDDCDPAVLVDSFRSQVVFDPKKQQFSLESSGTESKKSSSGSFIDDAVGEFSNEMNKVGAEEFHQEQTPFTGYSQKGDRKISNVKYDNETRSNKTDSSAAPQQNSRDGNTFSGSNMFSNNGKNVEKEQKQVNKRMSVNLYQYLEAEKPISESRLDVRKRNKTDKVITKDDTAFCTEGKDEQKEEKQPTLTSGKILNSAKQSDEQEEASEDREYAREQKKIKCRHKHQAKKGRDKDTVDTGERNVLVDITNERNELVTEDSYSEISGVKGHPGSVVANENKGANVSVGRLGKKPRPVTASAASPGRYSISQRPLPLAQQPVQHAIGQAIADHLFDGSTLASSVDSWASAFPQSPGLSHSVNGSGYSTGSPTPSPRDNTPLQSTPRLQVSSDQQAGDDDEYTSDGEFPEDPLLQILRQQRDHFLQQLIYIEKRLQAMET